jgi:hypothetical protein
MMYRRNSDWPPDSFWRAANRTLPFNYSLVRADSELPLRCPQAFFELGRHYLSQLGLCSVFSRHSCSPTVCSVFRHEPCNPESQYFGETLQLTIVADAPNGKTMGSGVASNDDQAPTRRTASAQFAKCSTHSGTAGSHRRRTKRCRACKCQCDSASNAAEKSSIDRASPMPAPMRQLRRKMRTMTR